MSHLTRALLAIGSVVCSFLLFTPFARAEDLPSDPALVTGQLDNGLHYIVRKHSVPAGRAVVWIHMHTGSMNETDKQRGIAHYFEHMAFNGSGHFKPGELVPFFQSMGMQFGRDQNAFTNMEQTTYQLSLPNTDPDTLGKGMSFFSDVIQSLSLLPTEIDNERQIILEERRRGLSGRQRANDFVMARLYPGSLYGFRETIGLEETIKGVMQPDFLDYYAKWYGAANATLIVIADTEPENVVKVIKEQFGNAPKKDRPTPQDMTIKPYEKSFAIVASDPELRSADVRIVKIDKAHPPTTTVEQYRDDLLLLMGESMLNHRFGEKASGGKVPYMNARASAGDESNTVRSDEISARANTPKWKAALAEMVMEAQRARKFGFTDRELERVKKDLISGVDRAVETESTTPASAMMSRINGAVTSREPVMSPAQRKDVLTKVLPTISLDDVKKRFAEEFDYSKPFAVVATLPSNGGALPSESELLELANKAIAADPTPEEKDTTHETERLLASLPTPGKVVESDDHPATGVYSAWLSNNVRLHYKFMDQRKDEVGVSIALIGGPLLETAANRGVTQAAQLAWGRAATKTLSSADLREFMTGKKIRVGGAGGGGGGRGGGGRRGGGGGGGVSDAITLSISGPPEELETGFQLAYLLLTEPKVEDAGFDQFQDMTRQMLQEGNTSPQFVGMRAVQAATYPDTDVRVRPMTVEQIDKLSAPVAQAWLDKLIKESPIEVTIVGDLPKERAIELATQYLGSLPSRDRVNPTMFADLRKLDRAKGPHIVEKSVDTPTNQAFVMSGFYGPDESKRDDVHAMALASRILSTRMIKEVREDGQLVYSIGASSRAGTTFPGFGVFSASAPTDPHKVPALVEKLSSMYEKFAKDGATDEEMDVARKQYKNTYAESLKEPAFWSGRLSQIDFRGMSLDELAGESDAYQAVTAQQVRETFAKYWSKDNAIVVIVKPSDDKAPTTRTADSGSGPSVGSGSR